MYNRELISRTLVYLCNVCAKEATLKCDKTKLYYCSLLCNATKDAPEIPIEPNQIVYGEDIKVKDKVVITSIINERCVFVCPKDFDETGLMNSVRKFAKLSSKLEATPEVDDFVLCWYSDDVYRAKVLAVPDSGTVSVQLIDFGNAAIVSLDDLMAIVPDCQRLKCHARRFFLKGVPSTPVNFNVVNLLVDLRESKSELVVTALDGDEVVLAANSHDNNINDRITALLVVPDDSGAMFSNVSSFPFPQILNLIFLNLYFSLKSLR